MVIVVGFDKPFIMAKAILEAQEQPTEEDFNGPTAGMRRSNSNSTIPVSVRRKVLLGIDVVGPAIVKQYLMELSVLAVGSLTGTFLFIFDFQFSIIYWKESPHWVNFVWWHF